MNKRRLRDRRLYMLGADEDGYAFIGRDDSACRRDGGRSTIMPLNATEAKRIKREFPHLMVFKLVRARLGSR